MRDVLDRKELPVRDAAGGPGSDDHVAVGEEDGVVWVLVLFGSEKHRDVHHREHLLESGRGQALQGRGRERGKAEKKEEGGRARARVRGTVIQDGDFFNIFR